MVDLDSTDVRFNSTAEGLSPTVVISDSTGVGFNST